MRILRILTTLFVLIGLGLLFSYPWVVGKRPPDTATVEMKQLYATRLAVYVSSVLITWFVAATSAILMVRRLRREYQEKSLENLANLITSIPEPKRKDSDAND